MHTSHPFVTDRWGLTANVAENYREGTQLDENVRDDAALASDFVASIKERGVRMPITPYAARTASCVCALGSAARWRHARRCRHRPGLCSARFRWR